jgi:hypothetical protein
MAVGIYTLPICDGCKLPWLPTGWKQDSDPRNPKKPLRCGKCKSSGWDRDYKAETAETLDRGFTPASPDDRKVISELMREVEEHNGSSPVESVPRGTIRCKHRMKTENCPICSKETAQDA